MTSHQSRGEMPQGIRWDFKILTGITNIDKTNWTVFEMTDAMDPMWEQY